MPSFYPTHPEPGDPPGLYGDVYFDGQNVTGRVTDPAHMVQHRAGEWFVAAESAASVMPTGESAADVAPENHIVPDTDSASSTGSASSTDSASSTGSAPNSAPGAGVAEIGISTSVGVRDTGDEFPLSSPSSAARSGPLARMDIALAALRVCSTTIADYDGLTNAEVELLHEKNAEALRLIGVQMAISTNQIDHRSAVELAGQGMARQSGYRTPIEMAKNLGGLTQQETMAVHDAGRIMREGQSASPDTDQPSDPNIPVAQPAAESVPLAPWLQSVSRALKNNELSSAQAAAIRTGLGTPTEGVPVEVLTESASTLVRDGQHLTPERLLKWARQMRDRLDRSGVALRESERRARRSAKLFTRPDGMMQLNWVMDPEEGMIFKTLVDRTISPKAGGPRTGDEESRRRIQDDPREPHEILADQLGLFFQLGATVDPSQLLATPTASVVVLTRRAPTTTAGGADGASPAATVTAPRADGLPSPHDPDMEHFPTGQYDIGWIDGHSDPVSSQTVDRLICGGSTTEVSFTHDGQPLDVGREQRLFGRKQRVALGAQFGGCTWTDKFGNRICPRPPSWSEAHHIEHWHRDNGKTVMANGILFCKLHHLELHNDGWEVLRKGDTYWLIPPASVDPARTPRRMPTQSDAFHDLMSNEVSA